MTLNALVSSPALSANIDLKDYFPWYDLKLHCQRRFRTWSTTCYYDFVDNPTRFLGNRCSPVIYCLQKCLANAHDMPFYPTLSTRIRLITLSDRLPETFSPAAKNYYYLVVLFHASKTSLLRPLGLSHGPRRSLVATWPICIDLKKNMPAQQTTCHQRGKMKKKASSGARLPRNRNRFSRRQKRTETKNN